VLYIKKIFHKNKPNNYIGVDISIGYNFFINCNIIDRSEFNELIFKDNFNNTFTLNDLHIKKLKYKKLYTFNKNIIEIKCNINGNIYYFQNDLCHSVSSSMYMNGKNTYYLYNEEYTYENWLNHPEVKRNQRKKHLELI
jgi:hypothetical protein